MFKDTLVVLFITIIAVLCFFSYMLGKSQAEIKYVTKEKEIVRYEKNCAVRLLVKPNLNDDDISRLFDSNKL